MDIYREIKYKRDRDLYYRHLYSDRLKILSRTCPQDGQMMPATGEMYLQNRDGTWAVEYLCPTHGLVRLWSRDVLELTNEIAIQTHEHEYPQYYLISRRPVKMDLTEEGGLGVYAFDTETGEFKLAMMLLLRLMKSDSENVEWVSEEEFFERVAELRAEIEAKKPGQLPG